MNVIVFQKRDCILLFIQYSKNNLFYITDQKSVDVNIGIIVFEELYGKYLAVEKVL